MEPVHEESPLCHALKGGAKVSLIEDLLRNENVSKLACKRHSNPLLCVAAGNPHMLLTADLVQLFINAGLIQLEAQKWYRCNIMARLQCALSFINCETAAIKLLMNLPDVDINDITLPWFLNLALSNPHCKPSTVEFLIGLGAKFDEKDGNGMTALHIAVNYVKCQPRIIKLLLQKGCLVNEEHNRDTPLTTAIKVGSNPDVVQQLLAAGARMNSRQIFNSSYFNNCKDEKWQKILHCAKIVVKHSYLKHNFDFQDWIRECEHCETLLEFAEKCVLELQKMELQKIGRRNTLYKFVKSCSVPLMDAATYKPMTRDFDYKQFLICVAPDDAFPIYFDIISSTVGHSYLEAKLMEIPLSTNTVRHEMERKIALNSDCMSAIADFLPEDDMLRFILALDDASNGDPANRDSKGVGKRGRAQSANFLKRPKRHQ